MNIIYLVIVNFNVLCCYQILILNNNVFMYFDFIAKMLQKQDSNIILQL